MMRVVLLCLFATVGAQSSNALRDAVMSSKVFKASEASLGMLNIEIPITVLWLMLIAHGGCIKTCQSDVNHFPLRVVFAFMIRRLSTFAISRNI